MAKLPVNPHARALAPVKISGRGKVLGRLASEVAILLRGKDTVHFAPHLLSGRKVIVTHAADVVITGKKMTDKRYHRHSGYLGGLKSPTMKEVMTKHPERIIYHAVRGMLPANRLRRHWLAMLEIHQGDA